MRGIKEKIAENLSYINPRFAQDAARRGHYF